MTDIEADLMIANAEIKRLQAQLAKYDEVAAEYGIDGKTMLTLAKSQIKTAQDNVELMEQLEESQRRADAAVEDMKNIVDAVREAHCDGTCCFACKYDADFSIGESGNYLNECPGFDRDDCFEWRGPQAGVVAP